MGLWGQTDRFYGGRDYCNNGTNPLTALPTCGARCNPHTHTNKSNSDLTDSNLRTGDSEPGRPPEPAAADITTDTVTTRHTLWPTAHPAVCCLLPVCSHLQVLKQLADFHEITYSTPQAGSVECSTACSNLALTSVSGIVSCSVAATVRQ